MKNELLPAADQTVLMTTLAAMDLITLSPETFTAEVYLPFKTQLAQAIDAVRAVEYDITTTAGMKVAVECRALFRDLRIGADKARKARKAPITSIGKLLEAGYDAVEERITPLEDLFDTDIKTEESRKEEVKQALILADLARTNAIEARIAVMRDAPLSVAGMASDQINAKYEEIAAISIDESFQEYLDDAIAVQSAALVKMGEAFDKARSGEEAAAKLAADQLAVEQERKRLDAERIETERKNAAYLAQVRASADAALAIERAAIAEQQRIAQAAIDVAKAESDRAAAELKAERDAYYAKVAAHEAVLAAEAKAKQDVIDAAIRLDADHAEALESNALFDAARLLFPVVENPFETMQPSPLPEVVAVEESASAHIQADTLAELEKNVADARTALSLAEQALAAFIASPVNNVFTTMQEAECVIESRLENMAHCDCEGAGNCGAEEYTQEFIVDGLHYMATLSLEYNRHDKAYYYIDGRQFSVAPI